jgi:acyl-CoA synthetase (NDP forming)
MDSEVIEVVKEMRDKAKKPFLIISAGGEFAEIHKKGLEMGEINTFSSPFDAAKCLRALADYYLSKKSR